MPDDRSHQQIEANTMQNSQEQLEKLNYRSQLIDARQIIELSLASCDRPVVSTKFSADSAVFLHLITSLCPNIPVIWVDTGYNTRATQEFATRLSQKLALNLQIFEPLDHTIELPPALEDTSHAAFTKTVKLEPFERALATLNPDVWFSSIRRYQSSYRDSSSAFQTAGAGRLKVSPMLNWAASSMERYACEYALPIGPDCFDPTKGLPFRECGLHTLHDSSATTRA